MGHLPPKVLRAWLRGGAVATICAGLLALGASWPPTAAPWTVAMDLVHWPLDGHPGEFDFAARASSAMLGGVMVGWGTMLLLIPYRPESRPALLGGLLAWFVADSLGSLASGFAGNLVVNVVFLLVLAPPMVWLKPGHSPSTG